MQDMLKTRIFEDGVWYKDPGVGAGGIEIVSSSLNISGGVPIGGYILGGMYVPTGIGGSCEGGSSSSSWSTGGSGGACGR